MTDITGYDSVENTVAAWHAVVPVSDPEVIGCYGNGIFANHAVARAAFPKATVFTYDVHATMPSCDALDIENGDASPGQAHGWAGKWRHIGGHILPRPTLYAAASNVGAVISDMLDAGWKRDEFNIHSAHTQHGRHICGPGQCQYPQADGTQWDFTGPEGQNVDQNVLALHFLGKAPKPVHDPHYGWFDTRKRWVAAGRSEQQVVEEYDRLRRTQSPTHHPHRVRLTVLRAQLWLLRKRLLPMKEQAKFHRGWREHQLRLRGEGKRVV